EQLDRSSRRHVQRVNLALSLRVLKFPHPLFADAVNRRGIVRRAVGVEIDRRTPAEHYEKDEERRHRPKRFQGGGRMGQRRWRSTARGAVLDAEREEEGGHQQSDEAARRDEKIEQMIDLIRRGRSTLWEKDDVCEHRLPPQAKSVGASMSAW